MVMSKSNAWEVSMAIIKGSLSRPEHDVKLRLGGLVLKRSPV